MMMLAKRQAFIPLFLTLCLLLSNPLPLAAQAMTPTTTADAAAPKGALTVGLLATPEQQLLGQMLIQVLADAGYTVVDKSAADAVALRQALEAGAIDLYLGDVGATLLAHYGLPAAALPTDVQRLYLLAKSLDARRGLSWLAPGAFRTSYAFFVQDELWAQNIQQVADLADYLNNQATLLTLCVDETLAADPNGLSAFQQHYNLTFSADQVLSLAAGDLYPSFAEGHCQVAIGRVIDADWETQFHLLTDSLPVFVDSTLAPVVREGLLRDDPDVATTINKFLPRIDTATLRQLNMRATLGSDSQAGTGDEEPLAVVAHTFLTAQRLLKLPKIAVGSEDYTEQLVLGNMAMLLLANAGYEVVDKTGIGGTKVLREAVETGAVDVYLELTAQTLAMHHNLATNGLPTDPDRMWKLAQTLDKRKGLIWLNRSAFNDTYTIMVRTDLWEQGIRRIEDLAAYMNANGAPLSICLENDFFARQYDGFPLLEKMYGFQFKPEKVLIMDLDEVYNSLRRGECDVAEGYSTDGRGAAWQFHNLIDTKMIFPPYNAAPVIRAAVLTQYPELQTVLDSFVGLLDDAKMSELNALVDIGPDGEFDTGDEATPAAVAHTFLVSVGLIAADTMVAAATSQ